MQFHNSKFTSGIITLSSVHFPPLQRALSTVVMLHYIHTCDKTMYPELHVQCGYIFDVSCRVLKYGFISVFARGGARLSAAGGIVAEHCVFGQTRTVRMNDKNYLIFIICNNKITHTHTHTHIYIYIHIYLLSSFFPLQARCGPEGGQLYSSMTVAVERSEWSAARPGHTLPPEKTRYPLYRRLDGPQGRSGRAENLVPTGIRSRTVQPVVSRYTD